MKPATLLLSVLLITGCKATCRKACHHVADLGGSESECRERCFDPAFEQEDIECVNDAKDLAAAADCAPNIKSRRQFLLDAYKAAAERAAKEPKQGQK